jgi:hypothetical protein
VLAMRLLAPRALESRENRGTGRERRSAVGTRTRNHDRNVSPCIAVSNCSKGQELADGQPTPFGLGRDGKKFLLRRPARWLSLGGGRC